MHINVLRTLTQTHLPRHIEVLLEVFYYINFFQETCRVKKRRKNQFFHTLVIRPESFRTLNLIKLGIQLYSISGLIMSGNDFGHFRPQGVKILKCHKLIFCSKFTKEHDGST